MGRFFTQSHPHFVFLSSLCGGYGNGSYQAESEDEQKLEQQYGQAVDQAVRERLNWELEQVDRAGAAGTIRLLREIRAALADEGRYMLIAGTWNSSFPLSPS